MVYSSIQLTARTRRRLAAYKTKGMSYEAVIVSLLDAIPAAAFHAHERQARASAAAQLCADLSRAPSTAADESRRLEAERLARITPAERMEEAYALYEMMRGSA